MTLEGPDGQKFESFESCVNAMSEQEDVDREGAQRICGSFSEVDKEMSEDDSDVAIKALDFVTKFLRGDYGQDEIDNEIRKGTTVSNLLDEAVDAATTINKSRDDIIQKISERTEATTQTIKNTLNNDVDCPNQEIIEQAAKVLPVDKRTLFLAGRADGCDYSMKKEFEEENTDVIQKNDEKQIVTGIVLKANETDLDGDYFPAEVVEDSAYEFMKEFQTVGDIHKFKVEDAHVVESYIAPTDFELNGYEIEKGDWVMSTKVENDEMWKAIKDGERNAYSVGGSAAKVPVEESE